MPTARVKCTKETEKAILVEDEFGEEHWLPKSAIDEVDSEVFEEGDEGELSVKDWYATKNGWPD